MQNDWGVAERQEDGRARAEIKASQRQRIEWEKHGRDHLGDFPEAAIAINTTGTRSGDHGKEESAADKEERGELLRGKLAEAEHGRIAGGQRHQSRRGGIRKRRDGGYERPYLEYCSDDKKNGR